MAAVATTLTRTNNQARKMNTSSPSSPLNKRPRHSDHGGWGGTYEESPGGWGDSGWGSPPKFKRIQTSPLQRSKELASMEARAVAAEAAAALAEARAVASEAAATKYATDAAAANAELQRVRAQLAKVQSPQQRRLSCVSVQRRTSVNTPAAKMPSIVKPDSPLSAMKKDAYGQKGAELLCSLENSLDFDFLTWPTSMRTIISGEPGVDYVDHYKRLTIVGFVSGNGGNVATLLEFLKHRRLLRDASSEYDFNIIAANLEQSFDFRKRSYYYDLRAKKQLNFLGEPRV